MACLNCTFCNISCMKISSDIVIEITMTEGTLAHTTQIPSKNKIATVITQGLLGNADNDPTNDLKNKTGETVPLSASEEEKFYFGNTCKFPLPRCLMLQVP